ncbi:hypothetical protein QUC31_009065 [Theobroma cacao]|uniref:Uncharacterized protein LOC18606706 n=2 Tax=Theobroma cacao TaxID=3641 RepID=A0AB32VCF5_THECC|nr:PREDICTED: uncharacterized protein LOC18606706 [Theobroma cacao]EOY25027.1 Uncharacterized protein TCM_016468 [Theobroma cacao]WRX18894.1 hypothetical protein QQP08_011381 [Theobroma cacao]
MGNCLKTSRSRQLVEEEEIEEQLGEIREATGFQKGNDGIGKGSIKVKIVLTKEELELFLLKLKNNNGGKSFEDLLAEMEKARSGKADSWRPSLESIMEVDDPEELEMDRS